MWSKPGDDIENLVTWWCLENRISGKLNNLIWEVFGWTNQELVHIVTNKIFKILEQEWIKKAIYARSILESFTDEMVNLQDENHIILDCNDAFSKFVWFPKKEIIWRKCTDILCDPDKCQWKCPIESMKIWNTNKYIVEYDWRHLEKSAQMVYDDCGTYLWIVEIYKDRSEIITKNAIIESINNSLLKTNKLLYSALENSNQWVWEWNIWSWEMHVDEHYYKILWYWHEEIDFSYNNWLELVHPDDKAYIARENRLISRWKKSDFQITHRIKRKSWDYIWVTISWKVCEKDDNWLPHKLVWTLMDITSSVDIKKILLEKEQRLEAIVKSLPELLLIVDKNWVYKEIASWNSKIFLWSRKIGHKIHEVFDRKNTKNILSAITKAIETREVQNIRYSLEDKWKMHFFEWNCQALNDDQVIIITREVTEDRELQLKLKKLATRDSLTWLFNAWTFVEMLKQSINNAKRLSNKLAVLFIDLDDFKKINDTYWHAIWDALLKEVSDRLLSATRWSDIVSRMWWDEFTVILNKLEWEDDAVLVIERIYNYLKEPFNLKDNEIYIWASLWVSMYPEHWETSEELLENADVSMYKIKKWGKWSYTIFEINKS